MCDRGSGERSSRRTEEDRGGISVDVTGKKMGLVTGQEVREASATLRLQSKSAVSSERAGWWGRSSERREGPQAKRVGSLITSDRKSYFRRARFTYLAPPQKN